MSQGRLFGISRRQGRVPNLPVLSVVEGLGAQRNEPEPATPATSTRSGVLAVASSGVRCATYAKSQRADAESLIFNRWYGIMGKEVADKLHPMDERTVGRDRTAFSGLRDARRGSAAP